MDKNLLTLISNGVQEIRSKAVYHLRLQTAVACLEGIWNSEPALTGAFVRKTALRAYTEQPHPPQRPPPWYIGMTSNFRKAIGEIDCKLHDRILEALNDITESPTTIRGDNVKPVMGALLGCWRYRLTDDDQLIYFPDQSSGNITLMALASRSSIHDD